LKPEEKKYKDRAQGFARAPAGQQPFEPGEDHPAQKQIHRGENT